MVAVCGGAGLEAAREALGRAGIRSLRLEDVLPPEALPPEALAPEVLAPEGLEPEGMADVPDRRPAEAVCGPAADRDMPCVVLVQDLNAGLPAGLAALTGKRRLALVWLQALASFAPGCFTAEQAGQAGQSGQSGQAGQAGEAEPSSLPLVLRLALAGTLEERLLALAPERLGLIRSLLEGRDPGMRRLPARELFGLLG